MAGGTGFDQTLRYRQLFIRQTQAEFSSRTVSSSCARRDL
jgi:hypothetical protein